MKFINKKILIMGLGMSGGGVEDTLFFLKEGAKVIVTDVKKPEELEDSLEKLKGKDVVLHLGGHIESDFKEVDLIIKNPAVPNQSNFLEIARNNNIPIEMGSGVFFYEANMQNIIGVTGTKGKSTTTALIYEVLKNTMPNIYKAGDVNGSPLKFLEDNKKGNLGVIELSSWRLEGVKKHKKSPHIAVITSIAQDHLNRYKSFQEYKEAKKIIVQFQKSTDFALLNYDSDYLRQIAPELQSKIIWFSDEGKPDCSVGEVVCYIKDGFIYYNGEKYQNNISDSKVKHHPSNIVATLSVASLFNIDFDSAIKSIKNFSGLFGRLQLVSEKNGIKWYNDTAATNPYATSCSINVVGKDNLAVIVGGEDKEMDFDELVSNFIDIKYIFVLPGSASSKIIEENKKYSYKFNFVSSLKEAVVSANDSGAKKVLFSPSSASFNMFRNEFDRGEKFIKVVNSL